ncbi:MAG: hypothetical protein A2622_01190 [Bdellovibrionales bacterium RIFCSPHIGHO2_01_FULL_40_29]|nr:MAG: hypothetical protein A2622_01190 [Bdellovibrionales bacterium RIFCSPHIGHO2_01_FULL_40_29]OFZ32728.1 MAG: hypothetical protein A3D17_05790 [Bdellovibrionales bacterium RIFCSPHIGHO2_02_FULL_40_15]
MSSVEPHVKSKLKTLIRTFLMPTFVGKAFVIYFGLHYSMYPGEGYGYGLVGSLAFTLISLVRFAWKYRNQEEF